MNSFLNEYLTPTIIGFILVLLGILIGKIKILRVYLGDAGILFAALLFGVVGSEQPFLDFETVIELCKYASDFGTSLFISVIGILSGKTLIRSSLKQTCGAFLAGSSVVLAGALSTWLISFVCKDKQVLLGLFSGSMTSTPALSAARECFESDSQVALGYGISYCLGLFSIVLFIQLLNRKRICGQADNSSMQIPNNSNKFQNDFVYITIPVLIGSLWGKICFLGKTGSILIVGMVVGMVLAKAGMRCSQMVEIKKIGLYFFLIGAGIPAGVQLKEGVSWEYFLFGALIALSAVLLGYLAIRYVFRFSNVNAQSILCGGMTSTPAIGILEERVPSVNLSLYSISYVGALLSLILAVKILNMIQ